MAQIPETGFMRLRQILGDEKANPPIPPLIPVRKSTWWEGVRTGRFPPAIKLSPGCTVWRVEDIRQYIEDAAKGSAAGMVDHAQSNLVRHRQAPKVSS